VTGWEGRKTQRGIGREWAGRKEEGKTIADPVERTWCLLLDQEDETRADIRRCRRDGAGRSGGGRE
jgi:hypothetical protein